MAKIGSHSQPRCLCAKVSLLLLAVCTVTFPSACSRPERTVKEANPSQPAFVNDVLSKYSLEELEQFFQDRTHKALHNSESPEVQQVPTDRLVEHIRMRQKTIYGDEDRRVEYYDVAQPSRLLAVNSVAALFKPEHLDHQGNKFVVVAKTLKEMRNLCDGPYFGNEPAAAYCTGFVVGPDLIATAGHCIEENWRSVRVVFGYRVEGDRNHPKMVKEFSEDVVFALTDIVVQKYEPAGADYAVVRVDRPIASFPPLKINADRSHSWKNTAVYTAGYPSGLPLKVADQAIVRREADANFVTNLDTFGGNSGSPIFNTDSQVIGILVRGDTDYQPKGLCSVPFVCPTNGCEGEQCTWISLASPFFVGTLKSIANETAMPSPVVKTFDSGPKVSGSGQAFSGEYVLQSDPPPAGYQIGPIQYSLTGDRSCGAWSTCRAGVEGDRAVMRFSLQGHNEWPSPGQAMSEGHLLVTYVPAKR